MRVPVVDENGKVRWAVIPDDCAGQLEHAMSIPQVLMSRAQVVYAVFHAIYGPKWQSQLSAQFKLGPGTFRSLVEKGKPSARQLEALEVAFQNCVARIRLVAKK